MDKRWTEPHKWRGHTRRLLMFPKCFKTHVLGGAASVSQTEAIESFILFQVATHEMQYVLRASYATQCAQTGNGYTYNALRCMHHFRPTLLTY